MLGRLIGEDVDLAIVAGANLGQVKADPGQLEQVVMNLCVNARDAMPDGGALRIETANVELDARHASPTRTHGAGPLRDARRQRHRARDRPTGSWPSIFEPFFTTKELGKGTGLGLAMVYGIVKQAGGYVWVDSEAGRGTTFKIYLPRVDEPVAAAARVQDAPLPPRGSETILLVEDEGSLRALAREILEETRLSGDRGRRAPTRRSRLASRHPEPIHLLLTDVVMPGMNGRKLAEALVARAPRDQGALHVGLHGRRHRASRRAGRRARSCSRSPSPCWRCCAACARRWNRSRATRGPSDRASRSRVGDFHLSRGPALG